jgi:hypothetical protein
MFNCINCGFNGTDRESLRNHSCLTSSDNWKERAEIRLAAREAAAEKRRDTAEEAIAAIVGRDLDSSTFWQLRNLFSEWESAEEEMGRATERLNSL